MIANREHYRTLQVFQTPNDAVAAAEDLLGSALGGFLANEEWHRVRQRAGAPPTRRDFSLEIMANPDGHADLDLRDASA